MSLDLNKVAPQVERMVARLQGNLNSRREQLESALNLMHEKSSDLDSLNTKIENSTTTFLVAGHLDSLDARYRPPCLPADFTVLATDGSHIEVDRHQAVRCFLLNISHVVLRYGNDPFALLESVPRLYSDENELAVRPPSGQGREQVIEGNLLAGQRSVEECRHLADMTVQLPLGSEAVAILDGTLMLWGLEPYPEFVTDMLLDNGLLREFDRIRKAGKDRKLAFGSYISAPRSTDVVNALRVAICPHETANCDKYCEAGGRQCDSMMGLADSQIFFSLLEPGERSAIFSSRSKIVKDRYGENAVHFFYVKMEEEIARVEIPRWVAADENLVGLTHAVVVDQCRRGIGYPVVLSEAHEQAVVTTSDRRNFWQLVEAGLVEDRLPTPTTEKSRSKRMRWI